MYLVELRPGKEELYRTVDDLALAIRDGDVDARSRIYHRATAKWISITLHPQYKAIIAGQRDELLGRPVRKALGLLSATLSRGAEDPLVDDEQVEASGSRLERWKRPLGFGLSGLLLVFGIQLAFSGPRPPWATGRTERLAPSEREGTERTERLASSGREGAVRLDRLAAREAKMDEPAAIGVGSATVSLASSSTVWPTSPERAGSQPAAAPTVAPVAPPMKATPVLPRAPRLRSKALRDALTPGNDAPKTVKANSVEGFLVRYAAASDSVAARLARGMRVARLNSLFSPARLTPGGGVNDTRLSLAGTVNFIRVFRQQQAAIDKAYEDSISVMARRQKVRPAEIKQWHSRTPRREAPALQQVTGSLIAAIDSLLGVLDAQAGAYKLSGGVIAFEDPAAVKEYGALRRLIKEQIDSAIAAGGAGTQGPAGLLLQAIGTSFLPRET
jgi:hypothetical protein